MGRDGIDGQRTDGWDGMGWMNEWDGMGWNGMGWMDGWMDE